MLQVYDPTNYTKSFVDKLLNYKNVVPMQKSVKPHWLLLFVTTIRMVS